MMLDLVAKAQGINKPLIFYKKRRMSARAVIYTYKGSQYCLRELSEISGFSSYALRKRMDAGWTLDEAMTKPIENGSVT